MSLRVVLQTPAPCVEDAKPVFLIPNAPTPPNRETKKQASGEQTEVFVMFS